MKKVSQWIPSMVPEKSSLSNSARLRFRRSWLLKKSAAKYKLRQANTARPKVINKGSAWISAPKIPVMPNSTAVKWAQSKPLLWGVINAWSQSEVRSWVLKLRFLPVNIHSDRFLVFYKRGQRGNKKTIQIIQPRGHSGHYKYSGHYKHTGNYKHSRNHKYSEHGKRLEY